MRRLLVFSLRFSQRGTMAIVLASVSSYTNLFITFERAQIRKCQQRSFTHDWWTHYSHLDLKPKRKIHLKQMIGCCRLSVILLQISVVAPRLSPSSNSANQPAEGDDTTPIYSHFWNGCRLMEQIDQLGAIVKAGAVVCCALSTFVRLLFWARNDKRAGRKTSPVWSSSSKQTTKGPARRLSSPICLSAGLFCGGR